MPRPQSKQDLIKAAGENYDKLITMISTMSEEERETPFDFSNDVKKTEAHWKRDKNVRDVIMHLHDWHKLLLSWIENNKNGIRKPFLLEGYSWKTYGDMNQVFFKKCQTVSLEEALKLLEASHAEVMKIAASMSNEELFQAGTFEWVGTSAIGSYFVSVTSSHYDWAMKKLKAHHKNVYGK